MLRNQVRIAAAASRSRVVMLMDDGEALQVATPLGIAGRVMLVDSEVEVEPGTVVRFIPVVCGDADVNPFELAGCVQRVYVDVLVSAYAPNRYLMQVHLTCSAQLVADLGDLIDGETDMRPPYARVPRAETNRRELVATGFWALDAELSAA